MLYYELFLHYFSLFCLLYAICINFAGIFVYFFLKNPGCCGIVNL